MGCKYAMVAGQVDLGPGYQSDQSGDIAAQAFQLIPFIGSGSDTCMQ